MKNLTSTKTEKWKFTRDDVETQALEMCGISTDSKPDLDKSELPPNSGRTIYVQFVLLPLSVGVKLNISTAHRSDESKGFIYEIGATSLV